ncbi:MAG: lipopolysaccharide heptosyltransferase II [Candidatus Dormiibacterota bacterium]
MNILVLKPCCIGDVLMTTPLLATLRAAYPDARIEYATGTWSRPAIDGNPDANHVLTIADGGGVWLRRLFGLVLAVWTLRWRRYDLAFIPDSGWFANLVVYLAGVPRRVGTARFPRSLLLTSSVHDHETREHQVDAYLRMAQATGLAPHLSRDLKFIPSQPSLEHAVHLLHAQGFDELPYRVALYPGGGTSPRGELYHKRWPSERYALLADRLITRHGGGVVLLGEESERELNFVVRNDIDHPVLDLTGRLDLDQMGAVIQLCDAIIANDSGPMQLGVAVGTPTVGLFGPTAARRFGPYGEKHRAVQGYTWCGPCYRLGGPMKGCGAACIQRITVSDVVQTLESRAG